MKRKTLLHNKAFFIFLLIVLLASLFGAREAFAYADESYTGATEDLRKAENFDPSYYPVKEDDYTISLIQIAESTDKELLVYTYQPAADKRITASSINISRTSELDVTPQNYYLTLLSREGVFCKYVVKDFKVSDEPTRYYAIPSIFRSWVDDIDGDQSGSQTVTEKSFEVAEQFRFGTLNGKAYVERKKIDVITVTSKFVGYVEYDANEWSYHVNKCHSHFIAFDTDKRIDRLIEASVSFDTRSYSIPYSYGSPEYGELVHFPNHLVKNENVDYSGSGLFANSFSWGRIRSVDDFISEVTTTKRVYKNLLVEKTMGVEFNAEAKAELQKQKWVLSFYETDYSITTGSVVVERGTFVESVTILRLKFVTDDITYNLGVVDNKQTGSKDPVNEIVTSLKLNPVLTWILLAILCVVLLVVLMPFLPTILSFLFKLVVWIVKAVVWLVSLPVRGVVALVRAIKERKEDR